MRFPAGSEPPRKARRPDAGLAVAPCPPPRVRACVLCAGVCACSAVLAGESFLYKWALSRDRRARRLCQRPSLLTLQGGLAFLSSTCPLIPDPTSNIWGPWQ